LVATELRRAIGCPACPPSRRFHIKTRAKPQTLKTAATNGF
jgi:hypothetical protein